MVGGRRLMAFTLNPLKWFKREKKDKASKKADSRSSKDNKAAKAEPRKRAAKPETVARKQTKSAPAKRTPKPAAKSTGKGGRRAQFKHDGWKLFVRNGRYSFQDMTQKEAKEQGYEVVYEMPAGYEIQEGAQKPVMKKAGATKKRAGASKTTSKSPKVGTNKSAAVKSFDQKQVTHGDYRLYRNGNRFYFSKKGLKEQKPGVEAVTRMPADKEVTTTGNGLPVLRNA